MVIKILGNQKIEKTEQDIDYDPNIKQMFNADIIYEFYKTSIESHTVISERGFIADKKHKLSIYYTRIERTKQSLQGYFLRGSSSHSEASLIYLSPTKKLIIFQFRNEILNCSRNIYSVP